MECRQRRWSAGAGSLIKVSVVLATLLWTMSSALADSRSQAREHYQRGQQLFQQGKYQAAIGEFESAHRLAPSPIMHFNIGLAHDKLGNRAEALLRYKTYLREMPDARNRALVEAKINRIEGELRAESERRLAEQNKADEVRRAEEARKAEEARQAAVAKAEADAKLAEEARKAEAARKAAEPPPPPAPADPPAGAGSGPGAVTPAPVDPAPAPAPVTPATPAKPAATGDPELDRVAAVDITALRDARNAAAPVPASAGGAPAPPPTRDAPKKKAKPAYKQWWFWVVVGVSAVILYDIASSGDDAQPGAQAVSAPVLLRF